MCVITTGDLACVRLRLSCTKARCELVLSCHAAGVAEPTMRTTHQAVFDTDPLSADTTACLVSTARHARWAHTLLTTATHLQMPSAGVGGGNSSVSFADMVAAAAAFAGLRLAYVDPAACVAYTGNGTIIRANTRGVSIHGSTQHFVNFCRGVYLDDTRETSNVYVGTQSPGLHVDAFVCSVCRTLAVAQG